MTDVLTILSAQFNNPEHTGAVIMTAEHAAVMVSERDRPAYWAQLMAWQQAGNPIAPFVRPPAPEPDPIARLRQALEENPGLYDRIVSLSL